MDDLTLEPDGKGEVIGGLEGDLRADNAKLSEIGDDVVGDWHAEKKRTGRLEAEIAALRAELVKVLHLLLDGRVRRPDGPWRARLAELEGDDQGDCAGEAKGEGSRGDDTCGHS